MSPNLFTNDWEALPAHGPANRGHIIEAFKEACNFMNPTLKIQDAICTVLYMNDPTKLTEFLDPKVGSFKYICKRAADRVGQMAEFVLWRKGDQGMVSEAPKSLTSRLLRNPWNNR